MLANLKSYSNNKITLEISSLPVWQQAIISSIESLNYSAGLINKEDRFNKIATLVLRPYIPYLIHETYLPGIYILLNRDYRPIGLNWFSMVDYEKFPHLHLSASDLSIIKPHYYHFQGWTRSVDGNFFMDGSAPWCSKKDAKALVIRLENIIFDLNKGAEIV